MSVNRRGFLSSLLGLAAASLSPIGLLFDRRMDGKAGMCRYWKPYELMWLTPEQWGGLTLGQWTYLSDYAKGRTEPTSEAQQRMYRDAIGRGLVHIWHGGPR